MITPLPKPAASGRQQAAIGTIHPDAVAILIREPVLEQILDYSEQDVSRELGGFLIGGRFQNQPQQPPILRPDENPKFPPPSNLESSNQQTSHQQPAIEVCHFLPALDVRSEAGSLTFTHETWAAMTRQVDQQFPGQLVLGWQHTHPDFGVFLSGYDLFIHRNFFREPWQIALVVDPQRCEFGFFQWRGTEIVDCGFICVRGIE